MPNRSACAILIAGLFLLLGSPVHAQSPGAESGTTPPAATTATQASDTETKTVEIDQTVITLPTTLRLKRHHSYFRLTHRFTRDITAGDFSQLAQELFSLDDGAIIGLEYRFGLTDAIQAGVHRSILGKTIEVFGKWDPMQETSGHWFGLSILPSIEGQNNLRQDPQPGIAATVSRTLGRMLVVYANPGYVHNAHTATLRAEHEGHEHEGGVDDASSTAIDTTYLGVGGRLRFRPTVSAVAEVVPRLGGYQPGAAAYNFGIEKLTRGHVLQLNFGNNFNSTPGMIARGGNPDQVYMGFNLSRKW
jgi:uncharacterized beta barrel domain-containing protein DUF5777